MDALCALALVAACVEAQAGAHEVLHARCGVSELLVNDTRRRSCVPW